MPFVREAAELLEFGPLVPVPKHPKEVDDLRIKVVIDLDGSPHLREQHVRHAAKRLHVHFVGGHVRNDPLPVAALPAQPGGGSIRPMRIVESDTALGVGRINHSGPSMTFSMVEWLASGLKCRQPNRLGLVYGN